MKTRTTEPMPPIEEAAINIIAEGTRLEGKIVLDMISRINGVLVGEVHGKPGSKLILTETAIVEGDIFADHLIVDGFVRGNIVSRGKVSVSRTGRVVGNIQAPIVELEFGAYFEGRCSTEGPLNGPCSPESLTPPRPSDLSV